MPEINGKRYKTTDIHTTPRMLREAARINDTLHMWNYGSDKSPHSGIWVPTEDTKAFLRWAAEQFGYDLVEKPVVPYELQLADKLMDLQRADQLKRHEVNYLLEAIGVLDD